MSLSPKPHTTPFSVTDILSPIEETYKRTTIEENIPAIQYRTSSVSPPPLPPPPPPHSQQQQQPHSNMNAMNPAAANPYANYMPQFAATGPTGAFPTQYCNSASTDFSHYAADPRHSTSSWYGANAATDPRFASKYPPLFGSIVHSINT